MSDDFLFSQIRGLAEGVSRALGRKNSASISINELSQNPSDSLKKELLILLTNYQFDQADEYLQKIIKSPNLSLKKKKNLIETYSGNLIQLPNHILEEYNFDIFSLSQKRNSLLSQLYMDKEHTEIK